jgi:hypothetical protein
LLLILSRAVTLEPKSHRNHDYILLSHLRLPQPGGPGSSIYIPQEQGDPVIPPGIGYDTILGYINQAERKPSARVTTYIKNGKKFQTHEV